MRYRPFGRSGIVISAVSLLLDGAVRRSAREWRDLVHTAMECGINGFEITGESQALLEGACEALAGVERELMFVTWRPRAMAADARETVEAFLARTGLEHLDLLLLQDILPASEALDSLRLSRRVRALGLASDDETGEMLIARGAFEAIAAPYSPVSGWRDRNRIKAAAQRDMAVIAHDIWPEALRKAAAAPVKRSLFARPEPLAGVGSYQFLDSTPGWDAESLCLAYVLTEPAVTTVRLAAGRPSDIQRLAAIPDLDLPAGVAAQIEMARFSVEGRRGA